MGALVSSGKARWKQKSAKGTVSWVMDSSLVWQYLPRGSWKGVEREGERVICKGELSKVSHMGLFAVGLLRTFIILENGPQDAPRNQADGTYG